jgi:hypothetical protein
MQLFGGFLPEGPEFEPRVVLVIFVVDRVALGHVLRSVVLYAYHSTDNLFLPLELVE